MEDLTVIDAFTDLVDRVSDLEDSVRELWDEWAKLWEALESSDPVPFDYPEGVEDEA